MRTEERELLTPWVEAFDTVFGEGVTINKLAGAESDAPSDLGIINFPDVVRPHDLIGRTGHFGHVPKMAEYMHSMGYDWNAEGRLCAAPTPATFRWLMETRGQPDAGYEPVYRVEDGDTMSIGPWLMLYLNGEIPLHVRSQEQYQRWLQRYDPAVHRAGFSFHVSSFLHDLTVHMLNYHLIPRSWMKQTSQRIVEAMPERAEKWKEDKATGPLTLTFFFDNDLNQYALQVWCRCRRPEDYADIFLHPQNVQLINDALTLRITQTLDGLGDVASGDTDDVQGLEPLRLQLR